MTQSGALWRQIDGFPVFHLHEQNITMKVAWTLGLFYFGTNWRLEKLVFLYLVCHWCELVTVLFTVANDAYSVQSQTNMGKHYCVRSMLSVVCTARSKECKIEREREREREEVYFPHSNNTRISTQQKYKIRSVDRKAHGPSKLATHCNNLL